MKNGEVNTFLIYTVVLATAGAARRSRRRCAGPSGAPRSPFGTSDLALFGPVAVRVQAVPVVPGVVASVAGGDDAASELEQQLLGGHLG